MRRFLHPALALLPLAACSEGGATTPTEAAPAPVAAMVAAEQSAEGRTAGPAAASVVEGELLLTHRDLDFRVTGDFFGDDPAGMGLYLERPANVGNLPMGLTVRQNGRNLWGTGLDQDTGDPYPDYVSVFQSSVGDVFRFREGGRALLGNGIGRPEADHVLTVTDRNNAYIDNVLNLARSSDGNSSRFVRAFDDGAIAFAVGRSGAVGVAKDFSEDVELDVAGRARARGYLQLEEPDQAINIHEVFDVLDRVRTLIPLRYTPTAGDVRPRYGLLETFVHDEVFPETVHRGEDGTRSVDYAQVTTLLVAAVKELAERVEALEGGSRVGSVPGVCFPPERRRPGGEPGATGDAGESAPRR